MKKLLLCFATVLVSMGLMAQTAWAETPHIGMINMQELLQKLPQMKQIGEDLKKQFDSKQKALVDAQNSFKSDADKYRRDSAVLSDKDKQATEDKLFKEQQDLQNMQMGFQKEYMAAQNKAVDGLMTQIKSVVEKIANDQKFDLILVNASIAYAKPDMNLTNQVLEKMTSK